MEPSRMDLPARQLDAGRGFQLGAGPGRSCRQDPRGHVRGRVRRVWFCAGLDAPHARHRRFTIKHKIRWIRRQPGEMSRSGIHVETVTKPCSERVFRRNAGETKREARKPSGEQCVTPRKQVVALGNLPDTCVFLSLEVRAPPRSIPSAPASGVASRRRVGPTGRTQRRRGTRWGRQRTIQSPVRAEWGLPSP